jgi:hypothetical protein
LFEYLTEERGPERCVGRLFCRFKDADGNYTTREESRSLTSPKTFADEDKFDTLLCKIAIIRH